MLLSSCRSLQVHTFRRLVQAPFRHREMGTFLSSLESANKDDDSNTDSRVVTPAAKDLATKGGTWPSPPKAGKVGIVSFNMLAPCYRRISERNALGRRLREGHTFERWQQRAEDTQAFMEECVYGPGVYMCACAQSEPVFSLTRVCLSNHT